jgi:hypothetical protein
MTGSIPPFSSSVGPDWATSHWRKQGSPRSINRLKNFCWIEYKARGEKGQGERRIVKKREERAFFIENRAVNKKQGKLSLVFRRFPVSSESGFWGLDEAPS